jgi:hypothetical protein
MTQVTDAGKRAELLLDHHKDTFQQILYHWKARNRLFMYILILLALMALDAFSPGALAGLCNGFVRDRLGNQDWALELGIVGTASWFLLLCLVIHYYQRSIHVDRQYRYIEHIEDLICAELGADTIVREGKGYRSLRGTPGEDGERPAYLRWAGGLYSVVFPAVLMAFAIYSIVCEVDRLFEKEYIALANLAIIIALLAFNVLYLKWVFSRGKTK